MTEQDFENEVREKLSEMDEEYKSSDESSDNAENNEEAEFSAESFEDFLSKTESKVSVKKEGYMPSPIFGNRDSNNHNKYRIFIENPNGKISFIFWDSIKNTVEGKKLEINDALAAFGNDVSTFESEPSYEGFKSSFGYDETEENLVQKAYNGCRKQMEKAKKLFNEAQLKELCRLASEY